MSSSAPRNGGGGVVAAPFHASAVLLEHALRTKQFPVNEHCLYSIPHNKILLFIPLFSYRKWRFGRRFLSRPARYISPVVPMPRIPYPAAPCIFSVLFYCLSPYCLFPFSPLHRLYILPSFPPCAVSLKS